METNTKICTNLYKQKWYEDHRGHVIEQKRKDRRENPEKIKAIRIKSNIKNREEKEIEHIIFEE